VSIGLDDPRKVGGRYRAAFGGFEYEVVGFVVFPDWRGSSIVVCETTYCVHHDPPCPFVRTWSHGTAWDPRWDEIISEPAGTGLA